MRYRASTEADEVVLCTLKIDANGVLSIKPDFSKGRQPYRAGGGLASNGRGMSTLHRTSFLTYSIETYSCSNSEVVSSPGSQSGGPGFDTRQRHACSGLNKPAIILSSTDWNQF